MAAPRVFLTRCESYDPEVVRRKVEDAFDAFGGAARFGGPGRRVLVKPNLLLAAPPDKAVTTHPAIVEAVARMMLETGATVTIGDSPGVSRAVKVAEKAGIRAVADNLGVPLVDFEESVEVKTPEGFLFKKIEIARAVAEADVVINLPKFKTHGQMVLTMATKNLFGCVAGPRKAQWHMAAGRDRDTFARLLLELSVLAAPKFSLIDGVVGMDGNGPSAGRVRPANLILAGEDAFAVDRIAARLVGLADDAFPLIRAARKMDAFAGRFGQIEVVGGSVDALALHDFVLPAAAEMQWFRSRIVRRIVKRAVAARPVVDARKCNACGTCVRSCPPEAMKIAGGRVQIDRSACISCFCCQEMCPRQAITVRRGWLARLLIHRSTPR